jgi:hypothetical protein
MNSDTFIFDLFVVSVLVKTNNLGHLSWMNIGNAGITVRRHSHRSASSHFMSLVELVGVNVSPSMLLLHVRLAELGCRVG